MINSVKNEKGSILVISLITMSTLIILGYSLFILLTQSQKKIVQATDETKAFYIAEAGLNKAVINFLLKDNDRDWSNNQNFIIYSKEKFGEGIFTTSSLTGTSSSLIVKSTGFCRNQQKEITAMITVDWNQNQPQISISNWQEK